MQIFLRILFAILTQTSDEDAEGLHRFAPNEVTVADAYEHVWSARVAAATYGVDADLLLAISWHESRYKVTARSPESGGRVSCGVMQPTPVASCPVASMLDGYLAGAEHLRGWIVAMHGNEHAALVGYAGGYRLLAACAQGPVLIRPAVDACRTPEVFRACAAWIARERRKAASAYNQSKS